MKMKHYHLLYTILLLFVLWLIPSAGWAQCNGVFAANTICGTVAGGIPGQVSTSVLTGVPGGSSGQIEFNNAGAFGGFTASGDATINTGTGVVTNAKINGVAFSTSPATDTTPVITAANTATYSALPNCTTGYLQYTTSTHLFSCSTPISTNTTITSAATTYTSAQINTLVKRSNAGAAMSDLLPGTGPGILAANSVLTVTNIDTTGILSIKSGSGATLKSSLPATGFVYVCPGQTVRFFSDGSNYWALEPSQPCTLAAATTFFVSTGGSNTNDGLTVSTPLADLQAAWNLVQRFFNTNGQITTLQAADGTYSVPAAGYIFEGQIPGQTGGDNTRAGADNDSSIHITGNTTTPANAVLSGASNLGTVNVFGGARISLRGFRITNSVGSYNLYAIGSWVSFQNMNWGGGIVGGVQIGIQTGSFIEMYTPYTINPVGASTGCHIIAGSSSFAQWLGNGLSPGTITVTGTPVFTSGFACVQQGGGLSVSIINTFSGTATGARYNGSFNGTIDSGGQGINYFPGNSAGVLSTGAQYN